MSQLGIFRAALILGAGALATACAGQTGPMAHTAAPAVPAEKQIYVIVQRGQSLDRIAREYRVAKQEIIAANHLKPPFQVKPGAVLVIPLGAAQLSKEATQSKGAPAKAAPKPPSSRCSDCPGSTDQAETSTVRGDPARLSTAAA